MPLTEAAAPPNHYGREDAVRHAAILWGKWRSRAFEKQLSASHLPPQLPGSAVPLLGVAVAGTVTPTGP